MQDCDVEETNFMSLSSLLDISNTLYIYCSSFRKLLLKLTLEDLMAMDTWR